MKAVKWNPPPKDGKDKLNYYPTPPDAVRKLLAVKRFFGRVWEPACGEGHVSKVLSEHGYKVTSTDLVDRGYGTGGVDFLTATRKCDHVLTNPPYSEVLLFVERALAVVPGKVAMLLLVSFLTSRRRNAFFLANPPARIWLFPVRISMARDGKHTRGGLVDYCWLVWDRDHPGAPVLG